MTKKLKWTDELIGQLGKVSDNILSKMSGISRKSLQRRREQMGILPFRELTYKDTGEDKYCPKCGKYKSPDEFGKHKSRWDGLQPYCKLCGVLVNKERLENLPEVRAKYLDERSSNRISKYGSEETLAMTMEEYRQYNAKRRRETEKIRSREDYRKNPEKHKGWSKRWKQTDTGKASIRLSKLRSHKTRKLAYVYWAKEEDFYIREAFNHKCAYCEADGKLELEHFIPISKGGKSIPGNLLYACKECNHGVGGKHRKHPLDWLIEKYGEEDGDEMYRYICEILIEHCRIWQEGNE